MKTAEKWAIAVTKAIAFVDMFGDNFGSTKLSDIVKISCEDNKLVVTNVYGTQKSFVFGNAHTRQIYEEIASNLEGFKTNYNGNVFAHQGAHAGKIITTISTKLILDANLATRERVATIILKGKEVSVRYEITETFSDFL